LSDYNKEKMGFSTILLELIILKALKVTEDTVVVSDRYYEGEAEGEVELH